jgi:glucose-6-phosphate 1-epimerase
MSEKSEVSGVVETSENGLSAVRVENRFGSLLVYRHGAHVVDYVPKGAPPVLFTSRESRFEAGKAIRGGVPLCFPWFGPHASREDLPSHGFARKSEFSYLGSSENADQSTTLRFSLVSSEATREAFPFEFLLEYEVTLARKLVLGFRVTNTGSSPFAFEAALHSYFSVSDVRDVEVIGLAGETYLDQLSGLLQREGERPLRVEAEVDRVYRSTATCRLSDPGAGREIVVEKAGSSSTVVWNPWIEKSRRLVDFGDDEYLRMLCIESANVRPHAVELRAGETHLLEVSLESVRLDGAEHAR